MRQIISDMDRFCVLGLIVFCFWVSGSSGSRAQQPMQGNMNGRTPSQTISPHQVFAAIDVLQFLGTTSTESSSSDSTRVDIYLAVSYGSLDFLYAVDKYVADYSVTIQGMSGDQLVLDRFESYNVLETINEHRDRVATGSSHSDAEQISLMLANRVAGATYLPPYSLHITIRDLDDRSGTLDRAFDTTIRLHLKDFHSTDKSAMSDLVLYSDRRGRTIVPFIGPDVSRLAGNDAGDSKETIGLPQGGIFAMLYRVPPDTTLGVVSEFLEEKSASNEATTLDTASPVLSKVTGVVHVGHVAGSGITAPGTVPEWPVFLPMSFQGLWPGRVVLRTFLLPSISDTSLSEPLSLETHALASASRQLLVRIASGIPMTLTNLDRAIDQLHLIASSAEWDSLSGARTAKEKRDAVIQFWKEKNKGSQSGMPFAKDEQPMEVFYARLDYANAHFQSSRSPSEQEGWNSDRGRVYIALGAPDVIDSASYERSFVTPGSMAIPYETWDYTSLGERYTFVDEYGFGGYRLRGAFPPEGTFIWNR